MEMKRIEMKKERKTREIMKNKKNIFLFNADKYVK